MLSTASDNSTGTTQSRDLINPVAVNPDKPNTIHLRDVPKSRVAMSSGGRVARLARLRLLPWMSRRISKSKKTDEINA